jgi:uncharacterized membrane protein
VADSDEQRWRELRSELHGLRARIDAIEQELDRRAPAKTKTATPKRRRIIETRLGLTLLNRVGVVTLILGAAFFFAYVAENQWIGPWPRIFIGVLAGALSLVTAEYLLRHEQKPFAQGMAGLGIALLFVSFYAGYGFYQLYPAGVALLLMLAPAGISLRYDAPAVVLLGLFGGYAAPALIETAPVAALGFVSLLNGVANRVAARRGWWAAEALAAAGSTYLFATAARDTSPWIATLFLAAWYGLFTISPTPAIRYITHVLAAAGIGFVWHESPTPFLLLSLALAGAGLRVAPAGLIGFWIAWAIWQFSPKPLGPSFVAATLVFLAYFILPHVAKVPRLVTALNGPACFTAMFLLLDPQYHAWMWALAAALAAAHGIAARRGNLPGLNHSLEAAFVLVAVATYFTGFLITVGWAIEAAALAYIGLRIPALAVLLLIAIRLVWFDVHEPVFTTMLNARFTAFVAAAASYWLTAKRIPEPRLAGAVYLLGHTILLWAGGLEIAGWALRNAAAGDRANVTTAGLSILGAAYGVALIAAGVVANFRLNRAFGLVLIGLVVIKLYAYDVWLLTRLYRTTAFIALGALLVLGSYLYSRYRQRIESWLQTEPERQDS